MDSARRCPAPGVAVFFHQHRHGQERLENLLHGYRAGPGSAAAVRRRKCLVQVEVHHVDAHVAGAGDADERVHVGAVHVEQRALACRISAISVNASSKMPSVEGLVIISPATSSVTRSREPVDVDLSVAFGLDVFDL